MNPTKAQIDIKNAIYEGNNVVVIAGAGTGKEQPISCIVKTPTGDKRLGDLVVGDRIYSKNGELTTVIDIFPQGKKDVYKVSFRDGTFTLCGLNHNWEVNLKGMWNRKAFTTRTLKELIDYGVTTNLGNYKIKIPLCEPITYPTRHQYFPAYSLGLFLGNGTFTANVPAFSFHVEDSFLKEKFIEDLHSIGYIPIESDRFTSEKGKQWNIRETSDNSVNRFSTLLRELNLYQNKYIPEEYLYGDIPQRLALLRGLMDTDGSIRNNRTNFSNTNRKLIDGVKHLVQSLGGTCIETSPDYRRDVVCFNLNIKMFVNPFLLPRKANKWSFSFKNPPSRYITEIKKLNYQEEQLCIKVDSEDELYLTNDFIVTHNTSTIKYVAGEVKKPSLYLVFNKANQLDAENAFKIANLRHMVVKTIHSLAYKEIIASSKKMKNKLQSQAYNVEDFRNTLQFQTTKSQSARLFYQVKKIIEGFCNSSCATIPEFFKLAGIEETLLETTKAYWLVLSDPDNEASITHSVYLKMFQLSKPDLGKEFDLIMLDECLTEDHLVKTDQGLSTIKALYNKFIRNEPLPNILSYNMEEESYEFKPMLNAIKNEDREVFLIESEGLNKIKCTANHPILTQRGYIKAEDLHIGQDYLILDSAKNQKSKFRLNSDQLALVIGSYLGDGHLDKRSKFNTYRLSLVQGTSQSGYFKQKCDILQISSFRTAISGYTQKESILQGISKTFVLDKDIWDCVLDDSSLKSLAIWYMDDGSLSKTGVVSFHTNSFTVHENEDLVNLLDSFGYKAKIYFNKHYPYLMLTTESSKRFLADILPYAHPDLQHKFLTEVIETYKWDSEFKNTGANFIKSITPIGLRTVYDITVQDNHNFITQLTRNENGVGCIVHNCQDSNDVTLDIFLNQKCQKVAVGDPHQAIYQFRGAVNAIDTILNSNTNFKVLYLKESWRFTEQIAKLANTSLNASGNARYEISGMKPATTEHITSAYLAKTNAGVLEFLIYCSENNLKVNLLGDIKPLFKKLWALLALKNNNLHKCYDPEIKSLETWSNFVSLAEEDPELATYYKLFIKYNVKELQDQLTKAIVDTKNGEESSITVSTIHKSKGMEWDVVTLLPDFRPPGDKEEIPEDFWNLLYIAVTRAKYKFISKADFASEILF